MTKDQIQEALEQLEKCKDFMRRVATMDVAKFEDPSVQSVMTQIVHETKLNYKFIFGVDPEN